MFDALLQATRYPNDYVTYLSNVEVGVIVRRPSPVDSFYRLARIFDQITWTVLFLTMVAFAGFLLFAYLLYEKTGMVEFITSKISKFDFIFLTFLAGTEPKPFRCFKDRSAGILFTFFFLFIDKKNEKFFSGEVGLLLWSLTNMLMILFYTCNLRAVLVAVERDTKINSLEVSIKCDLNQVSFIMYFRK